MTYEVGYVVGSLSQGSINRRLAGALAGLAPQAMRFTEIPIRDLPLYDHDLDPDFPPAARELKRAIEGSDALLFVTPEYNRSIPGALKNAIDWATRPWGANSLDGKPAAVIGASPGLISTAVAQQHLKSILSFTNSPVLAQPEAYIRYTDGLITDNGKVTDEGTEAFLRRYLEAFHSHVSTFKRSHTWT
ncbi:NADPH-dependent FMN reductase [Amycolatopsis sp. EV170708-02-1]|uniref:NADPH-dependent FMN reductase n=1 Tax=Amycolatopsis sp. EV170708-02-1 TaxID=2919322 RepID=UPI001F0BF05B|nr:NADPH-dependent FMN reductase [Amycolatopsis sp. EV170708-02-1]UMP04656.1 NAD(P)H-dependent oxidoreductase [Amycolatopsis sp. EV170708-02-1]